MVKECKVIVNNEALTTVMFGDIKVQMPPIKRKAEKVFVEENNGRYSIVDGMPKSACPNIEETIEEVTPHKKVTSKKTTRNKAEKTIEV